VTSVLQRGITSFFDWSSGPPPEVPAREFRGACHSVAQDLGLELVSFAPRNVTPNFHASLFRDRDACFTAICNATYPIVALVDSKAETPPLRYVDRADVTLGFQQLGFDVVSAHILAQPLTPEDLECLDQAEREQIKHWKPRHMGEVIFNWFD